MLRLQFLRIAKEDFMNYFKWHKWSAIIMLTAGVICLWTGHKMVSGHNS